MAHLREWKSMDIINVVDIEATCWEDKQIPKGQISEIIEIGIAEFDVKKKEVISTSSIFVIPKNSSISDFCTKLTTITPEQIILQGEHFKYACETLKTKYHSESRVWASYGDYDRNMFQKQCLREELKYPFGPRHINVKTLFALSLGLENEVGTHMALELIASTFIGTPHRAVSDALNIGNILGNILNGARKELNHLNTYSDRKLDPTNSH